MKINFFTFRIALMAFISCSIYSCNKVNSHSERATEKISVNYLEATQVNLLNYFTEPLIIELETNDLSFMSSVGKIVINKALIFILSSDQIFIFDIKGKFVDRLDSQGSGPQEYAEISDYQVVDKEIVVLDKTNSKLVRFSLPSLEFLEYEVIPFAGTTSFEIFEEYYMFHRSNERGGADMNNGYCQVVLTDPELSILGCYLPYQNDFIAGISSWIKGEKKPFSRKGQGAFYSRSMSDTIYFVNREGITISNVVEFVNRPDWKEVEKRPIHEVAVASLIQHSDRYPIGPYMMNNTEDFISFNYYFQENLHWFFKHKDGTSFVTNDLLIPNLKVSIMPPVVFSDEYFVSVFNEDWVYKLYGDREIDKSTPMGLVAQRIANGQINPALILFKQNKP